MTKGCHFCATTIHHPPQLPSLNEDDPMFFIFANIIFADIEWNHVHTMLSPFLFAIKVWRCQAGINQKGATPRRVKVGDKMQKHIWLEGISQKIQHKLFYSFFF
jgi:hypothetical protein